MNPRIAVAGLWHETNIFGPHAATLDRFTEYELLEGVDIVERHFGVKTVIGGYLEGLAWAGCDPVPVFSAGAWPGGPAPKDVIDDLLARLGDRLAKANAERPIDGVVLNLHGAMTAEQVADVEATTVDRIRTVLGPSVPIGAVLDLHANPTQRFVENCNVVIAYDTYPHVDMWERGVEVSTLIAQAARGRRLKTTIRRTPLLTVPPAQGTGDEPMRGIRARAAAQAAESGAGRISIAAGFAYTVPERVGLSALVVHDEDREEAAEQLAEAVVADIDLHADEFVVTRPSVDEAVTSALATDARIPVILADLADNIGGGSAGDGTTLLGALLARRAEGVLAIIADPEVAEMANAVGVGSNLFCELGGKFDALHGEPLLVSARVVRNTPGVYTSAGTYMTGQTFHMGPTAVLDISNGAATVLVTSRPTPPFHAEQFTHAGVDPSAARIIVAKGAIAWRSAYGSFAGSVIEVDTPGACALDLASLGTARARS